MGLLAGTAILTREDPEGVSISERTDETGAARRRYREALGFMTRGPLLLLAVRSRLAYPDNQEVHQPCTYCNLGTPSVS
jgi:hypothetical protein